MCFRELLSVNFLCIISLDRSMYLSLFYGIDEWTCAWTYATVLWLPALLSARVHVWCLYHGDGWYI